MGSIVRHSLNVIDNDQHADALLESLEIPRSCRKPLDMGNVTRA